MASLKYKDANGTWQTIYNLNSMESHSHGNILNDGRIGNTPGKLLVTGQNGVITADFVHYANQNLLHNWDFANAVNQRNYEGTTAPGGYTIDRWRFASSSTGEGAVAFSGAFGWLALGQRCSIEQRIEGNALSGKMVTFSAYDYILDEYLSITGTFPLTVGTVVLNRPDLTTVTLGYAEGYMYVQFTNGGEEGIFLKRVKLELGAVSTLHLDPPMDKAVELVKCQRYFINLNAEKAQWKFYGFGHTYTTYGMYVHVELPVPMRIRPSITWSGAIGIYAGGDSSGRASSITVSGNAAGNNCKVVELLVGHGAALSVNQLMRIIAVNDPNSHISLSADL